MNPWMPALCALTLATPLITQEPSRRPGPPRESRDEPGGRRGSRPRYSLEQATSDRAQLTTIAFNGLAFLTGDFGSASFIPPGKVADFFGFQHLRDLDEGEKGHNPMFLDRIAGNLLRLLTEEQRRQFQRAAEAEAPMMEDLARARLKLVAAYWQSLTENRALAPEAVRSYTADLFARDAALSLHRARTFSTVHRSLSASQRQALAALPHGRVLGWPAVDREDLRDLRPRGAGKLASVAFMTLASEYYSWVTGDAEKDAYFCPERHGTYFGGFYLKDMPIMGQRDMDIPTSLTGDQGEAFLSLLTPAQRAAFQSALERQRPALQGIVEVRRQMARALRRGLEGTSPDESAVVELGRKYGRLDADLALAHLGAFAAVQRSATPEQFRQFRQLRGAVPDERGQAFLYSDRMRLDRLPDTRDLFQAAP
ncbi:MAG: hypothetical protein LWW79_07555 [Holophagaceae bacterium]|nr:hypothetical protein [Holophagaceae bacterium]